MLLVKSLHIVFMVTWFGGLFYLPRLFVYHAMASDQISLTRFKIMERKLYYGIATPGAIFTVILGIWLITFTPAFLKMTWLHLKLALVLLLVCYHIYLGRLLYQFKRDANQHSHVFYRIINEIPLLFLFFIVLLVEVKPFGLV